MENRSHQGLSPLARGNLPLVANILFPIGPIPARAGEPFRLIEANGILGAYPRSRGGTSLRRWK